MNRCDKTCAVFREIERIRAQCLACNVCKEGNTMQIGGRGVVYMDSAENPETVLAHGKERPHVAPEVYRDGEEEHVRNVTALPPEAEERFREVVCTYFGLRPVEVLLCHHLANGGNLANFKHFIDGVKSDLSKYKHLDKRNAWALFKHIGKVFAPFRALAGGLIGKGKGGAVKRALGKQLVQLDMFED